MNMRTVITSVATTVLFMNIAKEIDRVFQLEKDLSNNLWFMCGMVSIACAFLISGYQDYKKRNQ